MTPSNTHFQQLVQAAANETEPQRLLFVFTSAGLPDDASDAQRASHAQGEGGTLTPLACVDKTPQELSTFDALVTESRKACPPWDLVFIAALSGQGGAQPSDAQVDAAVGAMVEGVRTGRVQNYLALGNDGEAVSFY